MCQAESDRPEIKFRLKGHALEPSSQNYRARVPQLLKSMCLGLCPATREATAMRSPSIATRLAPTHHS